MRTKTIFSVSLILFAALTSACSRNKVAAGPTPTSASAATDAADRESAKLRADSEKANAAREDAERASASTRAADKAAITTPVFFQFDRSEISEEGLRLLDQKVDALQRNASVRLRVEGNADDNGSDEYNMALSQRRAAIVNRYFTDRGIDASRIQIVSHGEERPACTTGRDEECRAKNRRDEFIILSGL